MRGIHDTIAAIATAPGAAGLAVVRLSGPAALAVADSVFRGGIRLAGAASHTLHHGWAERPAAVVTPAGRLESAASSIAADRGAVSIAAEPGAAASSVPPSAADRLDEVVAAIFRAPRSYTREDVVELSCHGGGSAARLLDALLAAGARLAGPGEFTLRAFLNGRIDLAQAEAVADVIHAETERARVLALGQLAGGLSRRLADVRAPIEDLLAEVEARVDFAEDVGGMEIPPHAVAGIEAAAAALADLLDGAAFARAVREGLRVPLVGAPNAGKSSLFNALVGEARAIVAAEPGTTRDRVSEPVELGGVRMVLSDTAGLRDDAGAIEAIGVARSRELLDESPLVLWVVDGSRPLASAEFAIGARLAALPAAGGAGPAGAEAPARRVIVALNKSDLPSRIAESEVARVLNGADPCCVRVSAVTGDGVGRVREALTALAGAQDGTLGAAVSNARHVEALERARAALARAAGAAAGGEPGEIVALELRECLGAIGEVTGQAVGEDLLDRIFARFCVGK